MMKVFSTILLFVLCLQHTSAQCIGNLDQIFKSESETVDFSRKRTYILCPNTRFETGVLNEADGNIEGGQLPLVVLSNAHVKCGNNGKSTNRCVIDGTGTYAMILSSLFLFGELLSENIIIEGVTVDFFVRKGQLPMLIGAVSGDITFRDCVFSNNRADPLFVLEEYVLDSRRLADLSSRDRRKDPNFKPNFTYPLGNSPEFYGNGEDESVIGGQRERELYEGRKLYDVNGDRIDATPTTSILAPDNSTLRATAQDRNLQVAAFRVTFQGCDFDYNTAPNGVALNQAALSVVRFTARTDPNLPLNRYKEFVSTMDARFIRCIFTDNIYSFSGDEAFYRSMIDFYSSGQLTLRQNCFRGSTSKNYGVVTANQAARIVNDRNWLDAQQSNLECPFIAKLTNMYRLQVCSGNAGAPACRANTPTRAPSQAPVALGPGIPVCFPGDAHCDVEGQGLVMMKDIKLGDKVLVAGDTYEPVYSFGHKNAIAETEYLRIATAGPTSLEISKQHMLFVNGRAVPASTVKIGDELILATGNTISVTSIRTVKKVGAYAPFTPSGTIIVNNVQASSFVAFQDSPTLKFAGYDTGVSFQFCALAFEAPHRIWCKHFSSCKTEEYTKEGLSMWVARGHQLFRWFFAQHPVVMFFLLVPTIAIFTFLTYPIKSLLTVGAVAYVVVRPARFVWFKTATH